MEREIKFRGRNKSGDWIVGDLIHNRGKVFIAPIYIVNPLSNAEDFEVDGNTIGQGMGLKDITGADIFEGDILMESDTNRKVVVEWNTFEFGFRYADNNFGYAFPNHTGNFKIVGNIYDNNK